MASPIVPVGLLVAVNLTLVIYLIYIVHGVLTPAIAESLNDGSDYLKSTLHTNTPGGDKNYFNRPVSGTMKLAVVFSSADSTLQVQVLDNDFDFGNDLSTDDIQHVCSSNSPDAISYFQIT